MTHPAPEIDRLQRAIGRTGFSLAAAGLAAGMLCWWVGSTEASVIAFQASFVVLLVMPVKNVFAMLAAEARRRDWWFVLLAATVIAELGLGVWDRLS